MNKLKNYIEQLSTITLSEERKGLLQPLINYLKCKASKGEPILLNFICTHNSRRSILAQVWAQVMSDFFNIKNVKCFSGGTEATALFPAIVSTLDNIGFQISKKDESKNPLYQINFSDSLSPIVGFSKKYDDPSNPQNSFAAIMTCSQADAGCPFVIGSEKRISLTYEDPKISDGTSAQEEVYKERSEQIAIEMKYVFSKINFENGYS